MQPIQPAVSVSISLRAVAAMIVAALFALLTPRTLIAPAIPIVPPTAATAESTGAFDAEWFHADYLARLIEARRYGAIEAAAAAIPPASRYAPWVPAAIALAMEQVEATATAYARMGMCRELDLMYRQLAAVWPEGSAMLHHVDCEVHWWQVEKERRYAELVDELASALGDADHARALTTCGAMHELGALPATCLAEACKAGEVALAEVLFAHLESRRAQRVAHVTDGDVAARNACERVGITFDRDGIAHARPSFVTWQPLELVRVHPDAPAATW